jgi:hypothetical protein
VTASGGRAGCIDSSTSSASTKFLQALYCKCLVSSLRTPPGSATDFPTTILEQSLFVKYGGIYSCSLIPRHEHNLASTEVAKSLNLVCVNDSYLIRPCLYTCRYLPQWRHTLVYIVETYALEMWTRPRFLDYFVMINIIPVICLLFAHREVTFMEDKSAG